MAKNCGKQVSPQTHAGPRPQAYYRLHNLLHTLRALTQHEDDLCCLLTEIGSSNHVTPAANEELRGLLEQMSTADLQSDLNAVWRSLSIVPPQRATTTAKAAKSTKKATRAQKNKATPIKKAKAKRTGSPAAKRSTRARAA